MEEKKTKKMTKAEAFEWLKCKKVDTIGLGKEVMKKLFDCGVKWANGKCEYYDFSDYLLIEYNGDLYHCGNCGEAYWRMHHFEEIYATIFFRWRLLRRIEARMSSLRLSSLESRFSIGFLNSVVTSMW